MSFIFKSGSDWSIFDLLDAQFTRWCRVRHPGLTLQLNMRIYSLFFSFLCSVYFSSCHLRWPRDGEGEAPPRRQGAVRPRSGLAEECRAGTRNGKICKITITALMVLRAACSRINTTDNAHTLLLKFGGRNRPHRQPTYCRIHFICESSRWLVFKPEPTNNLVGVWVYGEHGWYSVLTNCDDTSHSNVQTWRQESRDTLARTTLNYRNAITPVV